MLAQQPPHPPHPAQPRAAQPRQPRQPRQPPHPRASCTRPALSCSLSNRWNVARPTSAISSSPRTKRCEAGLSTCGVLVAGKDDADALPASESPSPAAPIAAAAATLLALLRRVAFFVRAILVSFACCRVKIEVRACPYHL